MMKIWFIFFRRNRPKPSVLGIKKEAIAIEAVLSAMEIPFEKPDTSLYNPEWEKMMHQSVREMKEGKSHNISINELEELWK